MKNIFALALIMLHFSIPLLAQDCPICGDWTGQYSTHMGDVKWHIRIKQNGDDGIIVRSKRVFNSGETSYDDISETIYNRSSKPNEFSFIRDRRESFEQGYCGQLDGHKGEVGPYRKKREGIIYIVYVNGGEMTIKYWYSEVYYNCITYTKSDYEIKTVWYESCRDDSQFFIQKLYRNDDNW